MSTNEYDDNCNGCKISRGQEMVVGKTIVELDGNWILNHYSGGEGFLGWMALATRYHRMELTDLNRDEAAALGRNLQSVDIALRQYWSIHFKTDPVERVYVVYFLEGVYDKPNPSPYHLHIHLIPRTKKFDQWLRREDSSTIVAWKIYELSSREDFPQEYRVTKGTNERAAINLMTYLKGYFWKSSTK